MKPENFTLEMFKKIRQDVIDTLEWELRISKKLYTGPGFTKKEYYNPLLLDEASNTIRLDRGDVDLTVLNDLLVVGPNDIGSIVELWGGTKAIGRTDYFEYAMFTRRWFEPKAEVPMSAIKYTVKKKLNKMFCPPTMNSYSFQLDCNLMKLFKEGTLPFEDVVRLSIENCEV